MKTVVPGFRAFTVSYNGRADRIISEVKVSLAFNPTNPPSPLPEAYQTTALWDTGATKSVITKATADALGLIPIGTARVSHAGGTSLANTFLVNMFLPNGVAVAGIIVTECAGIANNAGALIGMDIISQGDFSITNFGGRTCMSFRFPSIAEIDYVKEAKELKELSKKRVGRNDPCPCGKKDAAGKPLKYKKCCGK